ncbi:MAG: hypothetical protein K0U93_15690 [Gammaproteobacteria bacterium]|nr:hypothetical protein [Gammaproteobacteria bacterium]
MIRKTLISAALLALASGAQAATIFNQDFEGGIDNSFESLGSNYINNWGVHNQNTNPWVDGDPSGILNGNVLGHIGASNGGTGTTNYRNDEQSFYEFTVDLSNWQVDVFKFEFDTWIQDNSGDGFNVVAYSGTGVNNINIGSPANLTLLNPISGVIYDEDDSSPNAGGSEINDASGFWDRATGHDTNGSTSPYMQGVAMFDASQLDSFNGLTTIRVSFASDYDHVAAEGVNIDNIMLSGICAGSTSGTGNGPNTCTPGGGGGPGGTAPAPGTLALAALGLIAMRRRLTK